MGIRKGDCMYIVLSMALLVVISTTTFYGAIKSYKSESYLATGFYLSCGLIFIVSFLVDVIASRLIQSP